MKKRFYAIFLFFLILFVTNSLNAGEENREKEAIQNKKGINYPLKIEIPNDKNLNEGLKLLFDTKYEDAAKFFEKYLVYDMESLDELFGLSAISWGGLPFELKKGIEYFNSKIQKNKGDINLYYFAAIFKIMSIDMDQGINKYSGNFIKYNQASQAGHYVLALAFLIEGNKGMYLEEYKILDSSKSKFADRLNVVFDNSRAFKDYLIEREKEKK